MRQLFKFNIFILAILCLSSCEKPEQDAGISDSNGEIKLGAEVQNKLYTNDRNIKLDASNTAQLNGKRNLTFSWICKIFPVGQAPKINGSSSAVGTIDSLMVGKYNFQLTVKDDFGHLVMADYAIDVFQDTLTGAPKIVATADQKIVFPASFIVLGASLSAYANPAHRKLEFEWTLLQKPAGNHEPLISDKANISTYIRDLEPGNYQIMLKITNELGLSSYDTIGITVVGHTLVTLEYEGTWVYVKDDWGDFLQLNIIDADNFEGRTSQNTTITVLDMETQQLLDDAQFYWDINDFGLSVNYYDFKLEGKKAKLVVNFYK